MFPNIVVLRAHGLEWACIGQELGQVVVVPECATVLLTNSDGFDPAWKGTDAFVELQRIFLQSRGATDCSEQGRTHRLPRETNYVLRA